MRLIQNTNVAFRCPAPLKAKMLAFAEANNQHLSDFIRSACVDALRRQFPAYFPAIPTNEHIEQKLEEITR